MVRRFDTDQHVTPFLKALNTLRREATRQDEYTHHMATIIVMVDQYAESALGNRISSGSSRCASARRAAVMRSSHERDLNGMAEWNPVSLGIGLRDVPLGSSE